MTHGRTVSWLQVATAPLRTVVALAAMVPILLLTKPVWASDADVDAKIDEAINTHYLNTDFEKAEQVLRAAIDNCSACSKAAVAKAWMYIGIVRGTGQKDLSGARRAFDAAFANDSSVELDSGLAPKDVQAAFDAAKDAADGDVAPETEPVPGGGTGYGMTCTPNVTEVETRRPIPVSCETEEEATRAVLYFREFGGARWNKLNMGQGDGAWLVQIPCSATTLEGTLRWYVEAKSSDGDILANFGDESAPNRIDVTDETDEDPPAYPGKDAPERCQDASDCPEDMLGTPACPGTKALDGEGKPWGSSCTATSECESGLACVENTCESAPSCETNADCDSGSCVNLVCVTDGTGSSAGSDTGTPKNLIGLHFGFDSAVLSGDAVCLPSSPFTCFIGNDPFVSSTNQLAPDYDPARAGSFDTSFTAGTMRLKASYERLVTDKLSIGGHLGLGLNGSPTTETVDLIHASVFGKFWFTGMTKGFRPFLSIGGGVGQVDVLKQITVQESREQNSVAYNTYCNVATDAACNIFPIDAYRKLGTSFVGASLGLFINLGGHGPNIEGTAKFMFPETALVFEPTAGYLVGF